jgi:CRISPR-associated protein Cmr4
MGAVDLAVARDKTTGFPYLPGSSLKGALRAKASQGPQRANVDKVFGRDVSDAASGSGVFGDANLLFLPLATEKGLFAQVTSEFILTRFLRDAGQTRPADVDARRIGAEVCENNHVVFEDLGSRAVRHADRGQSLHKALGLIPEKLRGEILPRAVCVSDADFRVLLDQGLDLVTRVRINFETNTAADGQLWLEENLPAETVLWSLVGALRDSERVDLLVKSLEEGETYLGGHVTVGRGRTRLYAGGGR